MKLKVEPSRLKGEVEIPASKSHTIRAVFIASLAGATSEVINPLDSADGFSSVEACRCLGAEIELLGKKWIIHGTGGNIKPVKKIIDVGNSGTTARFCTGAASLGREIITITGDEQTRRRPMGPLINALNNLGADVKSIEGNGRLPVTVKGRLRGGKTEVSGVTSQFISSLLISCPLSDGDSEIHVKGLNEKPYVGMTLWWLNKQGIVYQQEDLEQFFIKGNQSYRPFQEAVPADFSSATFFLCAGAITDSEINLKGLDMDDTQGDKKIVSLLRDMGANIDITEKGIKVKGGLLRGIEIDMNDTPDALPAMSVVGCIAEGKTVLRNVPQARIKETDRITVMRNELSKMGGDIEELPDGLIIKKSNLKGAPVSGHGDHRVVMSLAVAGLAAKGVTEIETAEAMNITFPNFSDLMNNLGAQMSLHP
ncbi:MAG: 3-phosphoshikimate 1-carboxyvinyltransferase [Nitrospinae bacterium]|nr:3-phosphoshikimate 1-carboxyvinyltransferase [Nitrospinota bacterium]